MMNWQKQINWYQETDSTNLRAAEAARDGAPHGTVFVADRQNAGRGRRGRTWLSDLEGNLYCSLLLRPDIAPEQAPMLTLVAAVAVAEALERLLPAGAGVGIKWPNDLVVQGKKIGGILTEMEPVAGRVGHVIIGIGLNLVQASFEGELAQTATDLAAAYQTTVDRDNLLHTLLQVFEEKYELFLKCGNLSGIRADYLKRLVNLDREVRVLDPQGEWCGTAKGITDTGELLVYTESGSLVPVYAGEVSVRGIYGYV